ncbi:General substrate transporter [Cordyceps militaris]|uniref:General substrate transporter n=1 Tax=Cordyceps militaris TaxID=73501 RepID=A0A2H4SWJ1_CORMI|nr:General substrate transporter [Cordyceps militaris]
MQSAQRTLAGKKTLWQSICSNPKVVFIALFASLGGFEYGYQQGVLGQSLVMTRFTSNFPSVVNSSSATGWLTSILQLGGIVGSLSAGILSELISRKRTMFVACLWVILGSYLYIGAKAGAPSLLYAGRFFTGIGVGLFSGVAPLYNAELSLPEMRGFLVSFYQFATILGIMLSFWIGYASNYIGGTGDSQSDMAWRLPSIIQGIPAAALAIGIWFMPYSPRWLVKVGRDEEARATLAWMRRLPVDDKLVQLEFLEIKAEAVFEKKAFARDFPKLADESQQSAFKEQIAQYINCFRTRDNFKRISTGFLTMMAQQFTGIDSIIYYATSIFQSLGLTSGSTALLATGVTGVVFMASTIPAMFIIDRVGRKPMLIVGSIVMGISMVLVGIIVAKFRHDWTSHATEGWVAVALIWVYIAGFGATWGPVSWTIVAEIFPLSIRAKGSSIGAFSNWLNNFAIAFFVPPMLEAWAWGTYIFFAVFLAAGTLWVWLCLPETKNASLEEMDRVFNSHTGARDAEMLLAAQEEVGLTALLEGHGMVHDKAGSVAVVEHV